MKNVVKVLCLTLASMLLSISMKVGGAAAQERKLIEHPERIGELLERGELYEEEIPNPHWRGDACNACHVTGDRTVLPLRDTDINRLCNNCHAVTEIDDYIHPTGMRPPDDFVDRMPQDLRAAVERGGDKITCITCHDLPAQCDATRKEERGLNPRFFRGGPYVQRTDLCFNCHERRKYERYNPHDQITDEGELDLQRCYVCHSVTPDRRHAGNIDDVQFNLVEHLDELCLGCHPWRPHPGGSWAGFGPNSKGPNHLVVPPDKIRNRLARHEKLNDIIMPLEPGTGRVFCATCHNPHERGVQVRHAADKGADGVRRLRRGHYEICTACHDK